MPNVTNAAEGLPRRRFTVTELERMVEAGILPEDERIELIGGDVVVMSPKGNQHEILRLGSSIIGRGGCPTISGSSQRQRFA